MVDRLTTVVTQPIGHPGNQPGVACRRTDAIGSGAVGAVISGACRTLSDVPE